MIPQIYKIFNEVLDLITDELKRELERQGHSNTGKLIDSIETKIVISAAAIIGQVYMNDYWYYLDKGVPASKIPFQRGSGKKTSKYISALIDYFVSKGFFQKKARAYAFGTANKHKAEGMPTKASYRFSTNNKRLNFLTDTVKDGSVTMRNIESVLENGLELIFDNLIIKTNAA